MLDRRGTEEKMILIICTVSAATLLPFAIMRFLVGDYWVCLIDSVGFLAAVCLAFYVYRVREVEMAGIILSLLAISGTVLHIYVKGISEIYFLYPLMVATYFIVKPGYALTLSLLTLAVLLPVTWVQLDGLAFAKVYLSIFGCVLFTYAFVSQRNQQRDQLLQYSTKDSLTGAGNRRAMDKQLIEAIQRFERSDQPMSLIIFDLDEFKHINDTAGHALGDRLLKRVADIVLARIRITDKLFRYGGDEFVVLADPADLVTAAQLAEDLRALIEADRSVTGWQLSISLGVAEYARGEPQESWLNRADEALFASKRQGRNQVVVSETRSDRPIK